MTLVSGMKFLGRKFGFLEKIEEGNYRDKLNKSPSKNIKQDSYGCTCYKQVKHWPLCSAL